MNGIIKSRHAIARATQRFGLKNQNKGRLAIQEALKKGKLIEQKGKWGTVIEYKGMYLIIVDKALKTVLTKEMYERGELHGGRTPFPWGFRR